MLGVTGPKYGCALDVCKACTSHINGKAFNPCSVAVSDIQPTYSRIREAIKAAAAIM
jgi:isoquinoline 1-oxidoreductase alpha subunit